MKVKTISSMSFRRANARLRINIKSLVAESRINRAEQRRVRAAFERRKAMLAKSDRVEWCISGELQCHLDWRLKTELRIAYLTLAALRGRERKQVENGPRHLPDFKRLQQKFTDFGLKINAIEWWHGKAAIAKPSQLHRAASR